MLPILNTFARHYRKGGLVLSGRQVQSCMVEEYVWSIGQALAAIGALEPHLTSQEDLYIHLRFQYKCYSKQEPPPNRVNPTTLQFLRQISNISMTLGETLLMEEIDIIIIAYFFLLHPVKYTASK